MTNTDTADASGTALQVAELARAGSRLVRVTVNSGEAARAIPEIASRLADMGVVVPSTAFTDSDGRIAARVQGAIHREELKERLEGLLGDRSTPAPQLLLRHPGGD